MRRASYGASRVWLVDSGVEGGKRFQILSQNSAIKMAGQNIVVGNAVKVPRVHVASILSDRWV